MLDLVEQSGRDWAIEDQVAIKKLDFFDGLPPSDRRVRWLWRDMGTSFHIVSSLVWVWSVGGIFHEHWLIICFILPIVCRLLSWGILVARRWLIWLVVICVVMLLGIQYVAAVPLLARSISMPRFKIFIVPKRAGDILDRVSRLRL